MPHYNIFTTYLKELGVRYTSYSNRAYESHPYKNTLYGISDLLFKYHIPNEGIRINQNDLNNIEPPFIAHIDNDFIVIKEVSPANIKYVWAGKTHVMSINDFSRIWSGVVLVAEINSRSIEPNYSKNVYNSILSKSKNIALGVIVFFCLLSIIQINTIMKYPYWIILNIIGIYVSILLLLKQNKVESSFADRVCSLFNQSTCNAVLDTNGAKIFSFSWSEIGFAYFCANLLVTLCFPHLFIFTVWLNIIALPYSFWSIWYQYKIVHQWCILCLMVQILLWTIFIVNISTDVIRIPDFVSIQALQICAIYGLCILLTNKISITILEKHNFKNMSQKYNEIKQNEEVFKSLLSKQERFSVDKSVSSIILGNPKAKHIISILTNPHCTPCANMHARIEKLMEEETDKMCIQYIFSSFNDDLKNSNRFLIATYFQKDELTTKAIYNKWFKWGRLQTQSFMNEYCVDLTTQQVNDELKKHELWKMKNKLNRTPFILFDGYALPEQYEIEDMINFFDIDINL